MILKIRISIIAFKKDIYKNQTNKSYQQQTVYNHNNAINKILLINLNRIAYLKQ